MRKIIFISLLLSLINIVFVSAAPNCGLSETFGGKPSTRKINECRDNNKAAGFDFNGNPIGSESKDEVAQDKKNTENDKNSGNYKDFTDSNSSCALSGPNLISQNKPPYGAFDDIDADKAYSAYFKSLNISQSLNSGDDPFIKAKTVYRETQNKIFNCAILNSKLKIGQKIIAKINSKKGGSTNTVSKIENQNKSLLEQIKENKCTNFNSDSKITTFKIPLLENVTYQNCIYVYYLNYLKLYMKDSIKSGVKYNAGAKLTTNTVPNMINSSELAINNEKIHSKTVYNQALIAYSEFENTYGIHTLLLFIFDDYISIRNGLDKTLSPLSQLFYKIPKAQKQ